MLREDPDSKKDCSNFKNFWDRIECNNDELVFRLVAPDNSYVTGLDLNGKLTTNTMNINAGDEPYSIPVKNLNSILSKNITTAEIDDVDKLFRGEMTSKNTSYAGNLLVNRFEKYLQTEDNLHGFMNKRLGDHPSTFVEDMNNPSVLSATIVNSMDNLKDHLIDGVHFTHEGYNEVAKKWSKTILSLR